MGRMGIESMLEVAKVEQAMVWHLRSNHYPPIPMSMVHPCLRAVEYANAGEWNKRVRLPEGMTFKGKYKTAPVRDIVEAHHLEAFLTPDEDYFDYEEDDEDE